VHLGILIKRYRETHGLSMDDFAKRSGLSKAYISMLEKNKNSRSKKPIVPSLETIKSVSDVIGIDFNIVIEMIDPDTKVSVSNKSIDPTDYTNHGLLPVTTRKIPVIGNVHCGKPEFAEEDYLDIVESDIDADFALRSKGDSMIGAGIEDGDLVFVRKQPTVDSGELAVVLLGDDAAVKRVYKYETYITLNAENPAYAPIVLREGDDQEASILGKVVAHTHYYKEKK